MTTPQQFGEYLLFRKLTTDAIGETYRAGKIGSQGIERVVLLRLFNGAGVEPETVWRSVAERMGLHRILQNPHIGDGTDVGRVGSVPFVAYEYVSGKNLAELLQQARSRTFQIPTEHALFVIERLTFGLTAAYSTRHREERIQHGFLVPEHVLLSNEGEVRLIGFEAGPAMRECLGAAPMREAFGPYIAPDVGPGSPPRPIDDVFSLSALLYELLTGSRLPHPEDGNFDPVVDEAMLSAEEKPLPPALRALLKSGLAAAPQRLSDVQQWQQAFSRFISEAQYSPTTFNLAFFMHTLFGGEIEQESADIEREKATQVDVAALAQTSVEEPPPGPSDTVLIPPSAAPESSPPPGGGYGQYGAAARKPTNWKLLAPFALLAVLGGLGAAYYMSGMRGEGAAEVALNQPLSSPAEMPAIEDALSVDTETVGGALDAMTTDDTTPVETDLGSDAVDVTSVDAPPTPEEVENQIERLVQSRTREVEGSIEARYEEELALLRAQLEAARQAQEESTVAAAEAPAETAPRETVPNQGTAGPTQVATADPAAGAGGPPIQEPAARRQVAAEEPSRSQNAAPAEAGPGQRATQGEVRRPTAAPQRQAAQPDVPSQPATTVPVPAPVKVGDLVQPGPGVTLPRMTQKPNPRYPPSARRLGKEARVRLRILVDQNGRAAEIDKVSEDAGFGFDKAAIEAAKRTRWQPASKDGTAVKMWVDLTIAFRPQ